MIQDLFPTQPQCVADAGSWCATFYRLTNNEFLARSADTIVSTTMSIILVVVLAVVARYAVHRLIKRIVDGATSHRMSRLVNRAPRHNGGASAPAVTPRGAQRARTIGSVLRSISSTVILVIAAIMILANFGVNLAPILASAGIVGVAVGFGAQNLVRDFLSGMFMLLEDQYGVGDIVDLGEASGVVEAVGLRITTLRDVNGTVWYVRNGEILRVGNKSQGYAVAVVDLPVAHHADVPAAVALAGATATERLTDEDIAADVLEPVEVLGVEKVGPEGVTLRLTVRVAPGRQFAVQRALNAAITDAFDDAGVPRPGLLPATNASKERPSVP
ncbi:mechanosensitive ion channel family protein [Pseudonocardia sp.]|uniref:mechanosensitive ion channel family protein n=1 Tax=Pseudonocardia sp. TaxID=60912 RepID=UPI00261B935F|nr:mechanosensitive ion channel family protein [Pseudonocardia sp.]MCW2719533.1 mechanosensitive ion channel protein MscS [Pseudonocardia sp.]